MMPSGRVMVGPPEREPVSLEEAKHHLKEQDYYEDDTIRSLIKTARELSEDRTWRAFITQTWDVYYDGFGDGLTIPMPPLQEVVSVSYVDRDGASQELDPESYAVDAHREPATITAYRWPEVADVSSPITVRVTVGYGDEGADVPDKYRSAIKLILGHLFMHREQVVTGAVPREVPWAAKMLLDVDHARVMSG